VASGDAHTRDHPVACYVSFETRAFEIYATLRVSKDLSTDDTVHSQV